MRDYLKILLSVIAALLSLAALIAVVTAVTVLASGNDLSADPLVFPFAIAMAGFMLFGITGSIVWFGTDKALGDISLGALGRQVICAASGALASVAFVVVGISGPGGIGLSDVFIPLALVVPVVTVSVLWYWGLFIRGQG